MNRRHFLLSASAAAALVSMGRLNAQSAPPSPGAAAPTPPPVTPAFTALRRNVGIFTARGGTIGWLSNSEALAVIDTQFPDTAALCLAGIPQRGERMLDVVVNTHHHGDHTAGNKVFKSASKLIIAHDNVPALQKAAATRATPPTVDQQVYADKTFPSTWRMSLGDETVSAKHHGPAHTAGDIVVMFEKANVVHMGDIMFNRMYPVTDRFAGVKLKGWITVLEQSIREYPADAIYVFGHGNPRFGVTGKREDLGVLRDYISALLDHVQKEIAAGKTKEEIVTMKEFPGFPDFAQPGSNSRLPVNLGIAYDELTLKV